MGYSWQIKPKDSMVVPLIERASIGILNVTIGKIKELLTAKGFNAAILCQTTQGGYIGYIVITNFGNISTDLHLGTDVYFGKDKYNIGFTKPLRGGIPQTWFYVINDDGESLVSQTGMEWNGFAQSQTVDEVEYYVMKSNNTPTYKPIYVTTYTGNIYYHGDVPIIPNWESVRYIEGNDKTWLLSRIFNINDGEPVSNVSSGFSLASKTEVDVLIDAVLMDMSKVKVTYSIPEATYTYIKLVYKKGSIPVDKDDGTAIDILQTDTESVITGIADGSTYYFVIFTDKSTSEPVELTTIPRQETVLLDTENSLVKDVISDFSSWRDVGTLFSISDYTLVRGSTYPTGNARYTSNIALKKGKATKMYVEIEGDYALGQSSIYIVLWTTKPTSKDSGEGLWTMVLNTGGTNLPKKTVEVSLSELNADQMFYVGFHCADIYIHVTKIYFDDNVIVMP